MLSIVTSGIFYDWRTRIRERNLERVRHIFHRQAGVPNLSAKQFHDAIVIPICGILRTVIRLDK